MKNISDAAFLKRSHNKSNSHHCQTCKLALQSSGVNLLLTSALGGLVLSPEVGRSPGEGNGYPH